MRLQDMESDLKNQEAQRQRAQDLTKVASEYWQGGVAPTPSFPGGHTAEQMFRGSLAGMDMSPAQPQAQSAQPMGQGGGVDRLSMSLARLGYAQHLRSKGYAPEAQAEEDSALKVMPKVKDWQKVEQDGKIMYAPYFEDGTSGQPVPLQVAEKLEKVNRGGMTDLVNAYTGSTVRSLTNTVDPNTVYSGNITMRGQNMNDARERMQFSKPTFNADAGGFVYAPTKDNPNGAFQALTGFSKDKPLTESQGKAALFATRMDKADQVLNSLASGKEPVLNSGSTKRFAEGLGNVLGLGTESLGGTLSNTLGSATNWTQSPAQQKVEQAQRDFINAVLRQESGASISPGEFDSARKQYFPQPGDSDEAIKQKAANRRTAIEGMTLQAGPGAAKLGTNAGASSDGTKFAMLPPASQYDGKRMRADNGTIYRSVGGKWVKE
jgi:hypothetical protein